MAEGKFDGSIDLSTLAPATYTLIINTEEKDLANPASQAIIVYNASTDLAPDGQTLFVAENNVKTSSDGKTKIMIASASDEAYMYYRLSTTVAIGALNMKKISKGYDTLNITLPENADNATLTIFTVKNATTYQNSVQISRDKKSGLKIIGESFRDNLIPTKAETWNIRVTHADGTPLQTALALDMYNKALEALAPTLSIYKKQDRHMCRYPTYHICTAVQTWCTSHRNTHGKMANG